MGKNSWIEKEDRKRIQKEEVVDHVPEEQKGDPSSRLETSKGRPRKRRSAGSSRSSRSGKGTPDATDIPGYRTLGEL